MGRPAKNPMCESHIRHNIYAMKRQYGAAILLRRRASHDTDPKTGKQSTATLSWYIHKAAVLPEEITRNNKQPASLVGANKDLIQGGGFDVGKCSFLIDAKDLPKGIKPLKDDWICYDNKHFDIESITVYFPGAAWIVTCKELVGRVESADIKQAGATDTVNVQDHGSEVKQ